MTGAIRKTSRENIWARLEKNLESIQYNTALPMTSAIRRTFRENIWARFGKRRSYMKLCETMFFFKKNSRFHCSK